MLNSLTMRLTVLCLSPCCGLLNHTRSDSPNNIHNVILPKLKQMERESCGTACVALSLQFSNGCNHFELQSALCTLHQIKSGQRGNVSNPMPQGNNHSGKKRCQNHSYMPVRQKPVAIIQILKAT